MNANLGMRTALTIVVMIVSVVAPLSGVVSAAPAAEFCEAHADLTNYTWVFNTPGGNIFNVVGLLNPFAKDGFGKSVGIVDETWVGSQRWVRISYQYRQWVNFKTLANESCTDAPMPLPDSAGTLDLSNNTLVYIGSQLPLY